MVFKKMREWWSDEPDTVHEEVAPDVQASTRRPRRTFKDIYPEQDIIELVVMTNPKRPGSKAFDRYEAYRGAGTVGVALKRGIPYRDIDEDRARNYIQVHAA